MKRLLVNTAVLALSFTVIACGNKPSGVLEKIQRAEVNSVDDLALYYTEGTIKAMKELGTLAPKTDKGDASFDNKFVKGARWKVVEEKVEGDTAAVKIKYTDHPVENMKGYEMSLRMKKEAGQWKIDMEKEMNDAITMIQSMNKEGGLIDQMKKMIK